MLKGNGIWFAIAGLALALWVRNWAKTSSSQGTQPFTGITPQRGIFGTDGTPVGNAAASTAIMGCGTGPIY